jgi:hypothetical protein
MRTPALSPKCCLFRGPATLSRGGRSEFVSPRVREAAKKLLDNFSLQTVPKSRSVRLVEIAEILGVTHQRASKIVAGRGFSKPVGREGQNRLWDRREVTAWAKVWRREKPWR